MIRVILKLIYLEKDFHILNLNHYNHNTATHLRLCTPKMDQRADLKKLIEINAHDSIYLGDIFISSTNIITQEPFWPHNSNAQCCAVKQVKQVKCNHSYQMRIEYR